MAGERQVWKYLAVFASGSYTPWLQSELNLVACMANKTSPELTAVLSLLLGGPSPDAIPYRPEGEIALIELTVNSLHTFFSKDHLQPLPLPFMQQFSCVRKFPPNLKGSWFTAMHFVF